MMYQVTTVSRNLIDDIEDSLLSAKDFTGAVERGLLSLDEISEYVALQLSRREYFSLEERIPRLSCGPEQVAAIERLMQCRFVTERENTAFLARCMARYGDWRLDAAGYTAVDIGPGFTVYQFKPEEEE